VGWGQSSAPFCFAAAPGYHVADVVVDGVSAGALTTCTFTNVTADLTIVVSFAVVTFTQYRAGGGAWVQGTSVAVGAQGETRVKYRSQDVDGNLEAPAKACMVRTKTWKHVRFAGKHVLRPEHAQPPGRRLHREAARHRHRRQPPGEADAREAGDREVGEREGRARLRRPA